MTLCAYLGRRCAYFGETEDQHDSYSVKILEQAKSQDLKLNKGKCQIKKHKITYLGHILTKDGVKPDHKKYK